MKYDCINQIMRIDMSCDRCVKGLVRYLGWCLLFFSVFLIGCVAGQQKQGTALPGGETLEPCVVQAVAVSSQSVPLEVDILSNKKLTYTSLKQSFPLGISVYLPETAIDTTLLESMSLESNNFESDTISSITASYADKEKTTARITIFLKKDVNYEVAELEKGLRLKFVDMDFSAKSEKAPALAHVGSGVSPPISGMDMDAVVLTSESPPNAVEISGKPALLTGIGFNSDEKGQSELVIRTSHAVRYEVQKKGTGHVQVKLKNTDIPDYRQRPLDTTYFNSAVKLVTPVQRSSGEDASTISVLLREEVPYHIYRKGSSLHLTFDAARTQPPVFDQARIHLKAESESESEIIKDFSVSSALSASSESTSSESTSSGSAFSESAFSESDRTASAFKDQDAAPVSQESSEPESNTRKNPALQEKKSYSGEKIRLDFFETDIKNVFRILRSVSGNNFAIDKDVTGNVTLTLDQPVPWDQVLDLVLKMNSLGQILEGNIIRIATLETLTREENLRRASIEAFQTSLKQEKSLEPLFTEYISINYSSADSDIKSHVEKILTPDRGHVSVDTRTNMIILTDTREKIDQARELIYRLDKVTPQIMIEARVVEVSKDFSKELGINWGMATDSAYRDDLGGDYGFNVAMNYPVASSSSLSYTFSRITGTPFALNAHLTASETKGDVRIISSPRILTLDNKTARIKQGLEYAYLERDDSGGSSVQFKNIDLLLEVTPHVTPDARIAMSVHITKNDIDSVTDGVPSLSTNEAETELLVTDGNTIVIGGIVKTSSTKSKIGFPGLVNVPVLGKLFGSDVKKEKKNELLIFITPTIVQLEQLQSERTTISKLKP